ncbi:restriction endonuclease subunit S [Pontibacter korlensis]|uniref:restriction endonuclease subunit S n=1 Tax=Pontibacter korlensis TaxID=400092 RepID=UPI00061B30E4|nr:restriction endonuclease subunit S [Pontibacter korlensis]
MASFKTYKVGNLYSVASGLSKSRSEFGFGHPFVTFKDVFYNFFIPTELESLANTTDKERTSCSVKRGDIFLTRTSETMHELGMSAVALKDYENATFNGFTKRLRLKDKVSVEIDPVFIGYYFRTTHIRNQIGMHATMTTRASLNSAAINSIEITIPEIEVQKRIGEILKSIDDKIELNRRMNQTLEQMAQTLFRQYFVDGIDEENLPEGWRVGSIYQIADVIYGAAFSSKKFNEKGEGLPLIRIRDLKNFKPQYYTTENHKKATIINKGDIIVGMDAEFSPCIWQGEKAYLNQRVCYFKPLNSSIHSYFIFESIKPHLKFFEAAKVGTTVIHLGKSDIDTFKVIIPTEDKLEAFYNLIDPLFNKVIHLSSEINTLTQLRDTLLPKLISGEIDVMQTKPEELHEPVLS